MEEGIIFNVLTNPVEIIGENGLVKGLKCTRMELGELDESGRRRPVIKKDSEFVMEVDNVIMAIGQTPNPLLTRMTKRLETNRWGCIKVNEETLETTMSGVFAGGDAVTGAATVILAMGAGRKAAASIHRKLTNGLLV